MTPEIYNIDNYTFSLILLVGGTSMYLLRKLSGTLPSPKDFADTEESTTTFRRNYSRRDGRMLILLGLIFLPLSFLYAYFIKQPQVDRQKSPTLQYTPPSPSTTPENP